MVQQRIVHEVRNRQILDSVLFGSMVALGAGLSITLHAFGFAPLVIVAAVAGVIPVYAVLARLIGRTRFEPEVVGDNCYYLGFLFTLVSLAWTLYGLGSAPDDANVVRSVISGFGVALGSTIVGIMFRVLMQQFRTDADMAERQARADMLQAALRFRTELDQATQVFSSAARGVAQKVDELAGDIAGQSRRNLDDLHGQVAADFRAAGAALSAAAGDMRGGIAEATQQMLEGNRAVAQDLVRLAGEAAVPVRGTLTGLAEDFAATLRATHEDWRKGLEGEAARLRGTLAETAAALRDSAAESRKAVAELAVILRDAGGAIGPAADRTLGAMKAAEARAAGALDGFARGIESGTTSLSGAAESLRAAEAEFRSASEALGRVARDLAERVSRLEAEAADQRAARTGFTLFGGRS